MQIVEGPALPWPIAASAPRCAAPGEHGITTGPTECTGRPTHFALVRYPSRGRPVWCVFLCDHHAGAVPVAEPLDKPAAAELAERIVQHQRAMRGQSYRPATPLDLTRH